MAALLDKSLEAKGISDEMIECVINKIKEHFGQAASETGDSSLSEVRLFFTDKEKLKKLLVNSVYNTIDDLMNIGLLRGVPKCSHRMENAQEVLGKFRPITNRKLATADFEVVDSFIQCGVPLPTFIEAGPRKHLAWDITSEHPPRAAMVTTGGIAPGLNTVIQGIVKRHYEIYGAGKGDVLGIVGGTYGLTPYQSTNTPNFMTLEPQNIEDWLDQGGTGIKTRRDRLFNQLSADQKVEWMQNVVKGLSGKIDILYVIGGNGSMVLAHSLAKTLDRMCENKNIVEADKFSIIGIPKTMDNDIPWVWQTFGFVTAVNEAAHLLRTLHFEAKSNDRVCMVKLFGAESGFVAAHAALASGHVNAVIIPEEECDLRLLCRYIRKVVKNPDKESGDHALIVMAEGALKNFAEQISEDLRTDGLNFEDLAKIIQEYINDGVSKDIRWDVFTNEPRHAIRAVPAMSHDQIFCQRLANLAVDSAMAGFTDMMISQHLTEYVLIPLELVVDGNEKAKKILPTGGLFWKQVVSSTGQPSFKQNRCASISASENEYFRTCCAKALKKRQSDKPGPS